MVIQMNFGVRLAARLLAPAVLALALAPLAAEASVTLPVAMTFQSGAVFTGDVTFLDDFSGVTDVSGELTGYQYGYASYLGSGSTSINWVWEGGYNYAESGPSDYQTYLMDGVDGVSTTNWFDFAYNYADPTHLTFLPGASEWGPHNAVNYSDALVSGSIGSSSIASGLIGVPEPATWALTILGFGVMGTALRGARRRSRLALTQA